MSLAEERATAIRSVLRFSALPTAFVNYIMEPSNNPAQFPYHNTLHAHTVAYNCILAAPKFNIKDDFLIELVVAALMHDWNHSGGEYNDDVNIRRAENAYMRLRYQFKIHLNDNNVIRLIRATRFPHKNVETIEEKIIQDADLLQYAHGDATEWVRRYNEEAKTSFTNADVAMWMETQHYNTMWGKDMRREAAKNLLTY